MANLIFADYAATQLAANVAASGAQTTIIVVSSAGFPNPVNPQYFYATLADSGSAGQQRREVVKVIAIAGSSWTVVRGQGGTSPTQFSPGDFVELRWCKAYADDLAAIVSGGAPTTSAYVLAAPDAGLPNRRILTGSGRVSVVDGGATNPITLDLVASGTDNTKLSLMPANTIKGNNTAAPANPIDLTPAQAAILIGAISGNGVISISAGLISARPAPGVNGRVWLATDDGTISRDNGASWFVLEPALTGDVTSTAGLSATTIAAHAVTNAKLAQVPGATFKGNPLGSTADAQDMAGAVAVNLLPVFGPSGAPSKGIVPAPGAVAGQRMFLREDQSWAVPYGAFYSVKDYGALGNGSADDTAAINAAFAAMPTAGGVLYFPAGTYKVTAALTPWSKVMTVMGDGWNASNIATNSSVLDVVTVTNSVHITNLRFAPSVARTAGNEIKITTGQQVAIDNCIFAGAFCDIDMEGTVGQVWIDTCIFLYETPATGIGVLVNTNGSSIVIENCLFDAPVGAQPKAGVQINQCGDVTLHALQIIHHGQNLLITPTTGQFATAVYVTNCMFDTGTTGVTIQPTGSGQVYRCNFIGCWFASSAAQGIRIIGGGATTVNGIDFIDCQCIVNGSHGVQVDAGALNIRFIGGQFAQNTGDGLQFNTTDFAVIGVRSGNTMAAGGNTGYGVNVNQTTCDRFVVTANDLNGNSISGLNNVSTQLNWITGQNLGDTGKPFFRGNSLVSDTSNATDALRFLITSSVVNGSGSFGVAPNGTSLLASMRLYGGSNLNLPMPVLELRTDAGAGLHTIRSNVINGGTLLPIAVFFAGLGAATQWDQAGNMAHKFAIADQGYSLQVPASGFALTIPNGCSSLLLNPAGVLATGTITMPAAPVDGQIVRIATTQTVTALTLNANAGQTISGNVTTLSATAPASYMYVLSLAKWLKIGS
jgi:hypothetical protein